MLGFTKISIYIFYHIVKHCEKILDPYYGKVSCNGDFVGQRCQFTCYEGFQLSGPQERTCQENGTWSGNITKCLRKFKTFIKTKKACFTFSFCYLKMFPFTASLSILLKYPDILTLVSDRMFFLVLCKLHSIRTLKSLCSNLGYQNTFLEFF